MGILDRILGALGASIVCVAALSATAGHAQEIGAVPGGAGERRFAVVIGQSDYPGARLVTGTGDAGYIESALGDRGFHTNGASDLDQASIRARLRDLSERATLAGGAETIFIYLSGRVAQINGENYLLPVGTPVARSADVVLNGLRLRDIVESLRLVSARARILVVDAAAPPERLTSDPEFSPGLAKMDAPEGFLIAFNQSPGRTLPEPQPPMGIFAKSILDAIDRPVASFGEFFAFTRTRVFEETQNRQYPWSSDRLPDLGYAFFPPAPGQTLPTLAHKADEKIELASLSREEAFRKVVATDSIEGYQAFLVRFPEDEAAATVQYNLAVRREAEVWSGALRRNQPDGFWTYLALYPDGGNVSVARQRLARMGAPMEPPSAFAPVSFAGLPPPVAGVEMIASSASMPVEFIPRAPSLNMPAWAPVAVAAVAAATAAPLAVSAARSLPRVSLPAARPAWAAPVGYRPVQVRGVGGVPVQAVAPAANFQPVGRPLPAAAPAAMGSGPVPVRGAPAPAGANFQPLTPRAGPGGGQPAPMAAPPRIVAPSGVPVQAVAPAANFQPVGRPLPAAAPAALGSGPVPAPAGANFQPLTPRAGPGSGQPAPMAAPPRIVAPNGAAPDARPGQMPAQAAPAVAGRGGPSGGMAPQMAPRVQGQRMAPQVTSRAGTPRMAAPRTAAPRAAPRQAVAPRQVDRR